MAALSDIIFPSRESSISANNINKILGDLKRSNLSITNRLRSIQKDADFVEEVAAALAGGLGVGGAGGDDGGSSGQSRRPLVANERCGSWYIRPGLKGASAYFKSTDGHTSQWRFSTRRLNLHLLPIIEKCDGGKRMPDSLSKTVPIWCCVLNRALFPELSESHSLYVPPNVVSDSEKSQMLARVPGFVDSLRQLNLDLAGLRAQISKPIRPTWVTQETDISGREDDDDGQIFDSFRPVICCTSSRRITDSEMSGHSGYVQGAGDDTENWALGLTPPVFWDHAEQLLSAPEADLPELIRSLVASASSTHTGPTATTSNGARAHSLPSAVTRLTPFLHVSPLPVPQPLPGEDPQGAPQTWCTITIHSTPTPPETWAKSPTHMEVGLGRHKAASRTLRTALPRICEFACRFILLLPPQQQQQPGPEHEQGATPASVSLPRVLIADEADGRDLAAGVALALLCWCFSDDDGREVRGGAPHERVQRPVFTKDLVRARLGRIMTAMPDANPNRATLQSVNSFLMDWK
ncbi:hypothetical protein diail_702 [Diaporthe ilicicola]|nr:hypothetical protein diail_702 [Diaporthe ilicicola]